MISLQSKTTIESTTHPGVKFTVRLLNKIQRAKRDLPIIVTRTRCAAIIAEYAPLGKIAESERTPEQIAKINALDAEFGYLDDRDIKPAEIRAGLVSIEGLELDGAPLTADGLIESAGPKYDDLLDEISIACKKAGGLTMQERKNSQSDTTSTGQVDPDPTVSNVTPAGS